MANAYCQECASSSDVELVAEFWQQWQQLEGQLYKCCLGILKNPTEAEDALSRAMLKARDKIEKYAGKIAKLGAWLRQLTRNLCFDIIKEKSRGAAGVEDIEWVGGSEVVATAGLVETPEQALEKEERRIEIRRAIADLPQATRDTFVLHFYQQLSHEEIVEQQGISYDSVCKRISRAKKKLKEKLKGYFRDGDAAPTPKGEAKHERATESIGETLPAENYKQPKREKPRQEDTPQTPIKRGGIYLPEIIPESKEIARESREEVAVPEHTDNTVLALGCRQKNPLGRLGKGGYSSTRDNPRVQGNRARVERESRSARDNLSNYPFRSRPRPLSFPNSQTLHLLARAMSRESY